MLLRIIPLFLLVGLAFFFITPVQRDASFDSYAYQTLQLGDYVQFGRFLDVPIVWRVIHKEENGEPILMSDRILTISSFDLPRASHQLPIRNKSGTNYYPAATLRQWLNSSDSNRFIGNPLIIPINPAEKIARQSGFLANRNFTPSERKLLQPHTHKILLSEFDRAHKDGGTKEHLFNSDINNVTQNYDSNALYKTVTDKMFLLSVKQIKEWVYDRRNILGKDYHRAKPTQEIVIRSTYRHTYFNAEDYWYYWLNTANTKTAYSVRIVHFTGNIQTNGSGESRYVGVRPAFRLHITDAEIVSGLGSSKQPYRIVHNPNLQRDKIKPTFPQKLNASNITETGLTLTWTASTDNKAVTSYEILNGQQLIGVRGSNSGAKPVTNFRVNGLKPVTKYTFAVRARDAAGNVSATQTVTVKTSTLSNVVPNDSNLMITLNKNYTLKKYEPADGAYLGAYIEQSTWIDNDHSRFNDLTSKKHASFFRYVGYGQPFPLEWVDQLGDVGAAPHIAWEPNGGLNEVQNNEYLQQFAKDAGKAGGPIFLRFASEMNGNWTKYHGDPQLYKRKWRLIHDVMERYAPNVMMVWTVFSFPESTISSYYPGEDVVDWVGVNVYNVVYHSNDINDRADYEDPLRLLEYVYHQFSHSKPIQISEFGVTHFTTTDNRFYYAFKKEKMTRMYRNIEQKFPRVKSIFYFDTNNVLNAPEGRRINNYSITDNTTNLALYRELIGESHYLSSINNNNQGKQINETFTFSRFLFNRNGTTYVDIMFFENYLGLDVTVNGATATVRSRGRSINVPAVNGQAVRGFYNLRTNVRGLPLKTVAQFAGYTVSVDSGNESIVLR